MSFPRTLVDKEGRHIVLREGVMEDRESLLQMYESFEPKEVAMGLPPRGAGARENWVHRLLTQDFNLVAIHDGGIIGHATLLEVEPRKLYEYSIFIHQDYQNKGIGTSMTYTMKACAQALGFKRIWLTVNQLNIKAIKVFRKTGFKFVGSMDIEEEMILDL